MNFASVVARCGKPGGLMLSLLAALGLVLTLGASPAAQAASFAPLEIVTKSVEQEFSVEMSTTE
jgi:hypothetical protein